MNGVWLVNFLGVQSYRTLVSVFGCLPSFFSQGMVSLEISRSKNLEVACGGGVASWWLNSHFCYEFPLQNRRMISKVICLSPLKLTKVPLKNAGFQVRFIGPPFFRSKPVSFREGIPAPNVELSNLRFLKLTHEAKRLINSRQKALRYVEIDFTKKWLIEATIYWYLINWCKILGINCIKQKTSDIQWTAKIGDRTKNPCK